MWRGGGAAMSWIFYLVLFSTGLFFVFLLFSCLCVSKQADEQFKRILAASRLQGWCLGERRLALEMTAIAGKCKLDYEDDAFAVQSHRMSM
jgi:hypothetical protein